MRDDYWVAPLLLGMFALFFGGFLFGAKFASGQDMDNCEQYHKALPLQEIEPLCKNILGGTK